MSETEPDVIDLLAGIPKGSRLDGVRAGRKQARDNAQKSYEALLAPKFPGGVTAEDRYAVAAFVAGLHRDARNRRLLYGRAWRAKPGPRRRRGDNGGDRARRRRRPLWPLSAWSAHRRRQIRASPQDIGGKSTRSRRPPLGGARTCPSLDLPSSGRDSCSAAIVARRRVVNDRYRHVVATGRFSIVPDPRCRRVARSGRIRRSSLRGRD